MDQLLMKVVKTVSVDAPGLGRKIREARESDPRSLTTICREVGMSTMNWYRIEAEEQMLPLETLRRIEQVLGINFGVVFPEEAEGA